jgi:hypothetical protein
MDDIEAIKRLKGRHCRTMDTKDWSAMRQVFTDDVTVDTTASGGGVVTGADEFIHALPPADGLQPGAGQRLTLPAPRTRL